MHIYKKLLIFWVIILSGCAHNEERSTSADSVDPIVNSESPALTIFGNKILRNGQPFRLIGINRAGTEFTCIQSGAPDNLGWSIFGGDTDQDSIDAMLSWHINAVRIPLNEDCWLGINGVNPTFSAINYQNAVLDYVQRLHQNGLYVILDLHWTAPGNYPAQAQQPMANKDHSIDFWSSVATAYKDDPMVIFDLFNEPFINWNGSTPDPWDCWLNGCSMTWWVPANGTPTPLVWEAAGMQSLVDAIRATGATQPLMLGGIEWSNDMTGWLAHKPIDPANALVVSYHLYDINSCASPSCWTNEVLAVANEVPIVTGELGEMDCTHEFIDQYMPWADSVGISYLAWTWNPWGTTTTCGAGPVLIADWKGTPTPFGVGYRDHLLNLFP